MLHTATVTLAVTLALLSPRIAGASEGDGALQAGRATERIDINGVWDEPAWASALPFDGFVQIFPSEGGAPTERTEVRVLYDDRNLYVAFTCFDSQPDQLNRNLGRRDSPPPSDSVEVVIDSAADRRTAYTFGVNAGGVLFDSLVQDNGTTSTEWDAVWDAAVQVRPDGWSAELRIPLHILRFSKATLQKWGFLARRRLARTNEVITSALVPRTGSGQVSRIGTLEGLRDLTPRPYVELSPYLAARTALQPQFSDPSRPDPRLLNPALDVGLDLQMALSSELVLTATVHPDFGQVEADELILTLANAEPYFPEKRPFFAQGLELFQPPPSGNGAILAQQFFYSRRIGLTTPILGAAKVAWSVTPELDVALLDAYVLGAQAPEFDEATPDRRFRLGLLHFGPANALPRTPQIPQNFLVAVSRWRPREDVTLGGRVAMATPFAGACSEEDAALSEEEQPLGCLAQGGNTGAIEWELRSPDSDWGLSGQLLGSQTVGGPPLRLLADGTALSRGATGLGAYVTAGKFGGEPFRFDVTYRYNAPTLELNAIGYLPYQNEHVGAVHLRYTRPSGFGLLHAFDLYSVAYGTWTADGQGIDRNRRLAVGSAAVIPGFHELTLELGTLDPRFDTREIPGTGIAYQRVGFHYLNLLLQTNPHRPLSFFMDGVLKYAPNAASPSGEQGWVADAGLTYRPNSRFESKLSVSAELTPNEPRWVDQVEDELIFGALTARSLSLILRLQWVLTPRLTLQTYAQHFSELGRYDRFFRGTPGAGSHIRLSELTPVDYGGSVDFHGSALNLNLVLRWEYRLGSLLYFVYTRSQEQAPGGALPRTVLPSGLPSGPTSDAVMVKWSYFWSS
ncbi:DUF5916 domain-containing protein [Hyalangium gracile]|uniref:DUF5916 domain-containing protein n=1 Tax=Hyalangium gracile TaxID=394092 RepID=UPI001CCDBA3F|nr:DUF5916 domain-containing protein [Hyalangium gracile]